MVAIHTADERQDAPYVGRGFKLLHEHADDLGDLAANPKQRVPTGLASLDHIIDGPAAGEVVTFCGRSFTGKSLIATNIMARNPEMGMVFFSLEMPAHQVLQRMYAHVTGTPSYEVHRMVRSNRLPKTLRTAFEEYDHHVVVDAAGLTLGDMSVYLDSYDAFFGVRPDAVIIDYLEEIGGGKAAGEGWIRTEATASSLKTWSRKERMPVFVLHQSNKSEKAWDPVSEDSAKGGGFTESDAFIGLWRPGRNPDLGDVERTQKQNDMHMNVLKNRITNKQTVFDLEFRISNSGLLVPLNEDRVRKFYQ